DEVQFVIPIGLAPTTGTNTYPVVINSRGNVIRSTIQLLASVPDLFAANGRAQAFNVTNPMAMMFPTEPFTVTSANEKGETVATKVRLIATGVRAAGTGITVRIKDTDITGTNVVVAATDTPGIDQIDVTLPAALAGAGDATVIVTVSGATSRPADSAPRIQIN
ncbi:MAG TPA: hypothetical protein VM870_02130, partial [Pyrinomonadaceae bacterium]|nr:hypothetical protein [Pyrinomonadaceae bacterium]